MGGINVQIGTDWGFNGSAPWDGPKWGTDTTACPRLLIPRNSGIWVWFDMEFGEYCRWNIGAVHSLSILRRVA